MGSWKWDFKVNTVFICCGNVWLPKIQMPKSIVPHNLSLFTTSCRVHAMIFRGRWNSSEQANKSGTIKVRNQAQKTSKNVTFYKMKLIYSVIKPDTLSQRHNFSASIETEDERLLQICFIIGFQVRKHDQGGHSAGMPEFLRVERHRPLECTLIFLYWSSSESESMYLSPWLVDLENTKQKNVRQIWIYYSHHHPHSALRNIGQETTSTTTLPVDTVSHKQKQQPPTHTMYIPLHKRAAAYRVDGY